MAGWAVELMDGCDVDTAKVGIGATAESEGAKPPHANIGISKTSTRMIRGEKDFRLIEQATGQSKARLASALASRMAKCFEYVSHVAWEQIPKLITPWKQ
jgi:hypothetical protein